MNKCKHEWRQELDVKYSDDGAYTNQGLQHKGYYCIHCLEFVESQYQFEQLKETNLKEDK